MPFVENMLRRGDRPVAPTISQTSDVSKTSDVFPQGERRLFQSHLTEQVTSRHRMSGRHPMSNRNEFRLGNEIGFAIIISRWGENFSPYNFPDIGCFKNIRCLFGKGARTKGCDYIIGANDYSPPTLNRVINNKLTSAYQISTKPFISISK